MSGLTESLTTGSPTPIINLVVCVILSVAKDLASRGRFFAALRMTTYGFATFPKDLDRPNLCEVAVKSLTEYLTFKVPTRMGFVNITTQVKDVVERSGIKEGLVLCNAMHITASVFINDDEPGLHEDYKRWLEKLAPYDPSPAAYQHNRTGEDNGDAHHKRQIMGREVVVAVTRGKLDFGPWEQIFYGEFDGRRAKRVLVKVIGE